MKNSTRRPCNELDGQQWLRNSISVWSGFGTPLDGSVSSVPPALVKRLIETYLPPEGQVVLDAFSGTASTLVAAHELGKQGVGPVTSTLFPNSDQADSVDLCITSVPDWTSVREGVALMRDYDEFLSTLARAFSDVLIALKSGAYCCVITKDHRRKSRFLPFHSDLASHLVDAGFGYDDLIVWDRRREFNNLRPLGYPSVFVMNRVHEYVLIMRKPSA